jgi:dihydrofolate synthase/folylpolyglutamate synthase
VDAAVIEVGLGGRLDATNVITPRVAVITSLSYDHMAVLGSTLTQIAGEKAGIIKAGIPVVSSPQKDEAWKVLERVAGERHAPIALVGRDITYKAGEHSLEGQSLTVNQITRAILNPDGVEKSPKSVILRLPLLGRHQVVNAATAYTALKASGLKISDKAIAKGFASVKWPCRFDIVRKEPPVIMDSAHNEDSFEKLAQALDDYFPERKIMLIFGSSEDKDAGGMLAALKGRLNLVLATKAVHPRAIEPEKIIETATRLGLRSVVVMPVEAALKRALEFSATNGEIVLSAGSMFVTAEVKTAWEKFIKPT